VPFKGAAEESVAPLGGHIMAIPDPGCGALAESGKPRGVNRGPRRPRYRCGARGC
jgi:hypothetical protein